MKRIGKLTMTSALVLGVALAGCSLTSIAPHLPATDAPAGASAAAGTYRETFRAEPDGRRRSYRVHLPSGYSEGAPMPLVVVVHGAFNTGRGMEKKTGFSKLADREGFVAVYPDGIGLGGLFQHWNAGFCCGKALRLGIDDVDFIDQVIERSVRRLAVDPGRVYLIGESNGAMLVYAYAARHSRRLAAAGVSAGSHGGRRAAEAEPWVAPPPSSELPLIAFHGLADDRVPFAGREDESTLPVPGALAGWAEANGCDPPPEAARLRDGELVHQRFAGAGCAPVELYALEGWGHQWPGARFTSELPEGSPLRGFDAAETAWEFFSRWRRADDGELVELERR